MSSEIISLNVGGTKFCTSYHTLTWIPDTFFTSLLSGRIPSTKDAEGNFFIDRSADLFSHILNYLRTKEINFSCISNLKALKHEADFFNITPLVRRLALCEEVEDEVCGGIFFHAIIPPQAHPLAYEDKRLSIVSNNGSCYDNQEQQTSCEQSILGKDHLSRKSLTKDWGHPMAVTVLKGHYNWLLVSYRHYVCLYRLKDSLGWVVNWISDRTDQVIEKVALNAKHPVQERHARMVAVASVCNIRLWQVSEHNSQQVTRHIGTYSLGVQISSMFFIGSHLVVLSSEGKLGVWHSSTQNWQVQDVVPITSYDVTGSLLLMGGVNGGIFAIDMQKFPLRMKDNDLLVTELYRDPSADSITSISIYSTPKTRFGSNWMEIAYGTRGGLVRVVVQHPETPGQDLQLFQSFRVHCSPVTKVMISEKHLVSVCSEHNHVRTWTVTRFRGMINTQPGSTPLSSFKLFSIDHSHPLPYHQTSNHFGPYGEKDDVQVFIQKVVCNTDRLFVRLSSDGKRVCIVKSADSSHITSFAMHECESCSRIGARPRRYLFTGHSNGSVQIWDLSTALELMPKGDEGRNEGAGLDSNELMSLLDSSDLTLSNTPFSTPIQTPVSPPIQPPIYPTIQQPIHTPTCSPPFCVDQPDDSRVSFLSEEFTNTCIHSKSSSSSGSNARESNGSNYLVNKNSYKCCDESSSK